MADGHCRAAAELRTIAVVVLQHDSRRPRETKRTADGRSPHRKLTELHRRAARLLVCSSADDLAARQLGQRLHRTRRHLLRRPPSLPAARNVDDADEEGEQRHCTAAADNDDVAHRVEEGLASCILLGGSVAV